MNHQRLTPERHVQHNPSLALDLVAEAVIFGWARALDARAQLPEGFTQRAAAMAVHLAEALGLDGETTRQLRHGALLHDIGMMQVPDAILRKPGPLTPAEQAMVRLHPLFADEILAPLTVLHCAAPIPRYHHERWDGEGYPYGLKGEQTPVSARIFAVVGAWAAMSVDRPYRRALPPERAIAELRDSAGSAFDPEIVACFLSILDKRVQAA